MDCKEFGALLPGYLDGELEIMQSVEVEKHLDICETCRETVENQCALQSALHASALYHEPRRFLERDILRAVQKKEHGTAPRPILRGRGYQFAAALAALLLAAVWGTGRFRAGPTESDLLANEAL
ncbi:MAG: putative transrane anti-sigma factor, partial [Chthonomonadales bacterium]|nr:putative transrane anti-sigma factor [Chthonomonadales bacterium]